jgi:hypothetical protein
MTNKDIALTVGGILATMILAYMLYKRQQEQAAAASSSPQDVNAPDYYDDGGLYSASMQYAYGSQIASLATPTIGATTPINSGSSAVDVSSSTATGTDQGSQAMTVIGQFFHDYMSGAQQSSPEEFSTLVIPPISLPPGIDVSSIPVTAAQAQAGLLIDQGAANVPAIGSILEALSTGGVTGGAVSPPSTAPVTDSAPAHFIHVLPLRGVA